MRRISKPISIGGVVVGGGAPVTVQSMTNTDTRDAQATIRQIHALEEAGCEIIRVAVPDRVAAEALPAIKRSIHIPLVADIHFDYRLALAALDAGVDGLRLNPGNIGAEERVRQVVQKAKERQVPIRIGVNAGSLPKDLDDDPTLSTVDKMVTAAMRHVKLLEDLDFDLIKLSLKSFDVPTTIEAYRRIAELTPYPLHLGITEAGLPDVGAIRSAVGLGVLLYMGLGDTLRVSLTGDPLDEVKVGYEILKSLNLRQHGPVLISCPTCGRTEIDLVTLAQQVSERLKAIKTPIKVAVMGCVVNGPGEAKGADFGLAGGKGKGVIFRKGEIVRTVPEAELLDALMQEIEAGLN
ncbi:MAG TPA: flavodoxin-dependent (E)-4-hydroxy-3-methylbut-2-enyl-diphosphate synthase [Anaerolineae bacterium]|nr:flavodoxin-dependent (E)-4-hydroxy-3-methylbut-2-enyl-diphosphate synthase [Anaerolineae bacterium]HQK12385.1 flavodoxin-dependent (E)-4-hydroxy-3-methylbut-2-enyl-diphosphate synthase [Anaerolineae bacterium]